MSDHPILVSIITGTYNSMAYLKGLIESINSQTFSSWEMIFIDDGSSDGTPEFLKSYCAENPNFKLIVKQPEGSPAKSRILGIAAAKGKYLAFCDHDDFWTPDKLQIQMDVFAAHPEASIVHTQRKLWYASERPETLPRFKAVSSDFEIQSAYKVLYTGPKILFSSFITTKELMDRVGGLHPSLRGIDDYHIFLKLSEVGTIVRVNLPLTYYYEHDNNLSRVENIFVDGYFKVLEVLKEENASSKLIKVVSAHAFKSKGVTYLRGEPSKSLALFTKSLFSFFLPRTFVLFCLSLFLLVSPKFLRDKLVGRLMHIKATTPTLEDYVMRTSG